VASVRALTYSNYELIVQDGASSDGTREYLEQLDGFSRISVLSQPDDGIGQGFNRALQRCTGDIVGSVDADNRLKPGALDIVVRKFAERPETAVVYGGCDMITEDGEFIHTWTAPDFDLLGLVDGSLVPPFGTSFFSRGRCGAALSFDEAFTVVADFDLWLRLADLPIVRVFDVLADVRVGQESTTWNPGLYEKHCAFKLLALRRFVDGPGRDLVVARLADRAQAGIYLWALDSMVTIGADQSSIDHYFAKAVGADLRSERFRRVAARVSPTTSTMPARVRTLLLECGVECVRQDRPRDALVYLGLVRPDPFASGIDDLLSQDCRKTRDEQLALCDKLLLDSSSDADRSDPAVADLQLALRAQVNENLVVRAQLQAEVDKRDQMLAKLQAELLQAVATRDDIISRQTIELRNLWRVAGLP
jgi:Glycosyl transferase family 2